MPNPTKEQLKQKIKDLKEENNALQELNSEIEEELNELKMLSKTSDTPEQKSIRVQLHGGLAKELLD